MVCRSEVRQLWQLFIGRHETAVVMYVMMEFEYQDMKINLEVEDSRFGLEFEDVGKSATSH